MMSLYSFRSVSESGSDSQPKSEVELENQNESDSSRITESSRISTHKSLIINSVEMKPFNQLKRIAFACLNRILYVIPTHVWSCLQTEQFKMRSVFIYTHTLSPFDSHTKHTKYNILSFSFLNLFCVSFPLFLCLILC